MKTIKIKLDKASHLKEYEEELERWEGEGGSAADLNELLEEIALPLKSGEIFEVIKGSVISENNEFYYKINIKNLTENDRVD